MRPFQSVQFFLFCLAMVQLGHFLTGSYLRSCLTTIERLYGFNSKLTGLLVSAPDVGTLCIIVFVSYLGRRVHRPRTIAISTLIMVVAIFSFGAIYFVASPTPEAVQRANDRGGGHETNTEERNNDTKLCRTGINVTATVEPVPWNDHHQIVYGLMFAALVIFGVGMAPINPLGVSYLDDAADPGRTPLYVAVLFALSVVGPAFGHLIASKTLTLANETRGPLWNIGFFVGATIMILAQIPLWFFPKNMPKQKTLAQKAQDRDTKDGFSNEGFDMKEVGKTNGKLAMYKVTDDGMTNGKRLDETKTTANGTTPKAEEDDDEEDVEQSLRKMSFLGYVKGFFEAAKEIVKEPIWCLMTLSTVLITAMIGGVISFQSKYLEIQFGATAGQANLLLGAFNIPVGIVGIVAGGYIMKKRAYTLSQASRHCVILYFLSSAVMVVTLFLGCSTRPIAGVNKHLYPSSPDMVSNCNRECGCEISDNFPICSEESIEYLSPCHAGCESWNSSSSSFEHCACISSARANAGKCDHSCPSHLWYFIAADSAAFLISGMVHSPGYIIFLRSVKPKHKSLAIGLQYLFIRALGKFPSPIYFGAVVDSTCLLWSGGNGAETDAKGSCLVYDSDALRMRFWGVVILVDVFVLLTLVVVSVVLWRREKKKLTKDEVVKS